jgi:hypothetical protein
MSANETLNVTQKRPISWEPSHSWRTRKADEPRFLSWLERRDLRDALLTLEKSRKAFKRGFLIKPQGDLDIGDVNLPSLLARLVINGLIIIDENGNQLRCCLTADGVVAVENWLRSKPPNFKAMFPRLYQQLIIRRRILLGREAVRGQRSRLGTTHWLAIRPQFVMGAG